MTELEARFARALAALRPPPGTGLVAVSGGTDSLVLLDLLVLTRAEHGLRLVVGHVDHGLHPESASVAAAVADRARALELPFETARLDLETDASETTARAARYRWLEATLERLGPGVILTAHHRDDQVETVLMRVLRGSGPAGLAGMAPRRGRVLRPLLGFSREEVHAHAAARGIAGWADPANLAPRHLRSWVRQHLLPMLRARVPAVEAHLLSLAAQAGVSRAGWDLALEQLPLAVRREAQGISVASAPFRAYDSRLSACLLGAVARRAGLTLGRARARRVLGLLGRARSGARTDLGGGWIAEIRFDRLALVRPQPPGAWSARLGGPEARGEFAVGPWRFRWSREPAPGRLARVGWTTWLAPARYEVRPWAAGDRIRPLGGTGRRLVVRCMQDAKVGRSDRSAWPVVSLGGTVLWVPGVCRADASVPLEGTEALRIDVERG